jgi:hypothetical protein
MNHQNMLNSIGVGGAIFVGLAIFWFVFVYLKRRMTTNSSYQGIATETQVSWEEKRSHPRVELYWSAEIEGWGPDTEIQLKDVSLGGAFVVCQEPPDLPHHFKIKINFPDAGSVSLNAVVVWSNFNMSSEKVVNRGMGIKFVDNEPHDRQQLQDAINAACEKIDDQHNPRHA